MNRVGDQISDKKNGMFILKAFPQNNDIKLLYLFPFTVHHPLLWKKDIYLKYKDDKKRKRP